MNLDTIEYQLWSAASMRTKYLTIGKREAILETTTTAQREYLNNVLKRGKKTVFANAMARQKGLVLPENIDSKDIETLLNEWVLEDYIDSGFVNQETRCECGRPLRYQYIVRHLTTNEVLKFGINHFEDHMSLPAAVVDQVKKGFLQIDYELDELLQKLEQGWSFEQYIGVLPNDFILNNKFQEIIDIGLPLLDRQIMSLLKDLEQYNETIERTKESTMNYVSKPSYTDIPKYNKGDNLELELSFSQNTTNSIPYLQEKAYEMVVRGISSTRVICELLIENHQASRDRFLTGKPKIYADIAPYLESFVKSGEFHVSADKNMEDRQYIPL